VGASRRASLLDGALLIKCRDVHYRGAIKWHASALTGIVLGIFGSKLFGAPAKTTDEGAGLLMFARKPLA
jgi:hypothetical protein